MDVRERVGLNPQGLRREKGLSQEELADLADIHQTYLSGVERGKRNPTIKRGARRKPTCGYAAPRRLETPCCAPEFPTPLRELQTDRSV
jgi:hypothetical protein